jgi:endonuclease YncB( thermonuclease family)
MITTSRMRALLLVLSTASIAACGAEGGDGSFTPNLPKDEPPTSQLEDPQPIDRVVDGDTLDIYLDGVAETVRVKGIDTPELYSEPVEDFAALARDFTLSRVGAAVDVVFDSACGASPLSTCRDSYDRLLAYITVSNGDDLAAGLLERGLARVYVYGGEHFDRRDEYEAIEDAARAQNLGIWSD